MYCVYADASCAGSPAAVERATGMRFVVENLTHYHFVEQDSGVDQVRAVVRAAVGIRLVALRLTLKRRARTCGNAPRRCWLCSATRRR